MSTKTQSDRVWETLRSDIIASRVLPGSKLRINDIAETSEVSLGAVREALSRLSAEGLVIAESQKGYRVAPLSAEELLDITDARVEIERIALSRSIARGDLEWETNLVAAWHRLSRTPERVPEDVRLVSNAWAVAHAGFHQALVSACGSARLLQIRAQLYEQSERYRRYSGPVDNIRRDVEAEHQRIFDAAVARDVDAAMSAISDHLRRTAAILVTTPALEAKEPESIRRLKIFTGADDIVGGGTASSRRELALDPPAG
jgi:DNA-binding GntR family transcriptional regulator